MGRDADRGEKNPGKSPHPSRSCAGATPACAPLEARSSTDVLKSETQCSLRSYTCKARQSVALPDFCQSPQESTGDTSETPAGVPNRMAN